MYSIHMHYCDDPENCGSLDEQHWIESIVPEWLKKEEDSEDASYDEEDDLVPVNESDSPY